MRRTQWARLQADVNCRLRRGAWYRLLVVAPLEAVVDVNRTALRVPRYLLEIVSHPPRRWTVVPTPRAASKMAAYLGETYVVCPSCRGRVPLKIKGRPNRLPCERCRTDFEVAWDESYPAQL